MPFGPLTAQVPEPEISSLEVVPDRGEEGERLTFRARASHPGEARLTWIWTFSDGSEPLSGSDLTSVEHAFGDDGDHEVTLRVSDPTGASATRTATVTVTNADPEVEVLEDPGLVDAGEPVTFSSLARDPGRRDVLTYRWSFGDGGRASGEDLTGPSHTYESPGRYELELTVEDDDGGSATRSLTVLVEETFHIEVGGATTWEISGDFENRPVFQVLGPGQATRAGLEVPGGFCQATLSIRGEGGSLQVGGLLPAPLDTGSYPLVFVDEENLRGSFTAGGRLDCSGASPPCRTSAASAGGGSLRLTRVDRNAVEGELVGVDLVAPAWGREEDQRHVVASGWFAARLDASPEWALGEGICLAAGSFVVEGTTPEPDAENVDWEEPGITVTLGTSFDPATLTEDAFRLEFPGVAGGGAGQPPDFRPVGGTLEPVDERTFRFVPARPLRDGVIYRARLLEGPEGLRGRNGERLEGGYEWRFATTVDLRSVVPVVYQASQVHAGADPLPLVPGKPTLTRVYTDWSGHSDVHEDHQVKLFSAEIRIRGDGTELYPPRSGAALRRPDQFTAEEKRHALNSQNFFGWEPGLYGGTTEVEVVVEPAGQTVDEPRRFRGTAAIPHAGQSPVLSFDYYFLRVGDWEDGVPDAAKVEGHRLAQEGALFTTQNMPVIETRGRSMGELSYWAGPTRDCENARGEARRCYVVGDVPVDALAAWELYEAGKDSYSDVILGFVPSGFQKGITGVMVPFDPPGKRVVLVQVGDANAATVTHEFGHFFGLRHCPPASGEPACPNYRIVGFRMSPSGRSGHNKHAVEGNEEASRLVPVMHWQTQPVAESFMANRQYRALVDSIVLAPERGGPDRPPDGLEAWGTWPPRTAPGGPWIGEGRPGDSWIGEGRPSGPSASLSEPQGTALAVRGWIGGEDGPGVLEPLYGSTETVGPRSGAGEAAGPWVVELRGARGTPLESAGVAPLPDPSFHGTAATARPFRVVMEAPEGVESAVLRRGERIVSERHRSASAPRIRILEPAPGAVWDGETTLRWAGSDPDGDTLHYRVAYRPGDEAPWTVLAVDLRRTTLTLDPGTLHLGSSPTLRIEVSDGFRSDRSELGLSLAVGPRVLATWPEEGAVAGPRPDVLAVFAASVDSSSVSGETFRLVDEAGEPVPATVRYRPASRTALLVPREGLEPGRYRAVLEPGVADPYGNRTTRRSVWEFRVAPPGADPAAGRPAP